MREFPSISDYHIAVENKYYPDQDNKFSPVKKDNNELHFEPGGRAVVYKVEDKENKIKAIKYFTVNRDFLFDKYTKIHTFLSNKSFSNYFVKFEFIDKLIFCPNINLESNENYFPGLIMDWADGKTLGSLVKELTKESKIKELSILVEKFKELSLFILENNFGHGDLKHDNIIVDANFNFKLIDYDDMFIPDFEGAKSTELGTPSFQHPKRNSSDFNKNIDDFSILSIYTSLLAFSKFPNLYEEYEDQQNLLFRLEDFENPFQSKLFQFLETDNELLKWSYIIKKSLSNNLIYIPELINYLKGHYPKPSIKVSNYPLKIISGKEVEIKWETVNADEVIFNNKTVNLNGQLNIKVNLNERFLFRIKNPFISIDYIHNIEILPIPIINQFITKQQKLEFGKTTQLTWKIQNGEKAEVHFDGQKLDISLNGEIHISPQKDTLYKLIVTALDGETIFTKETNVRVYHKIQYTSFTTNFHQIPRGVEIELSWKVENAENLVLHSNDGLNEKVSSSEVYKLFPTKSNSYWLEARNDLFNSKSETIRVEVDNAPQMSRIPSFFEENQIPLIDLKMPELQSIIQDEIQLEFEKMIQPKRSFSISKMLNSILRK
jgi:hypothetical protein